MAEVQTNVNVHIGVSKSDAARAMALAPASGLAVQVVGEKQLLDPFSWMLIGGGTMMIAHFIVDQVDKSKGGLIVDLSASGQRKVHRDKEVPYGYVVVVSADGKDVQIEAHDAPKDTTERLISEIISGAYKTAEEIKDAAKKVLPGHKVN